MNNLVSILKAISALVAAMIIGNWFIAELKKANARGKPWYQPYLSIPGLLILFAIILPVIIWLIKR